MRKAMNIGNRPMANLSLENMKRFIPKIEKMINELKAFELCGISKGDEPSLKALSEKISRLITDIFSNHTHEFFQYHPVAQLTYINLSINPNITQVRDNLKRKLDYAVLTLEGIKDDFIEKTQEVSDLNNFVPDNRRRYWLEGLHPNIRKAAEPLFLDGHYAESIRKATVALDKMVQEKSQHYELSGAPLMEYVFGKGKTLIKFNEGKNKSEQDEQIGFMHLFKGVMLALRNPRSHELSEDDVRGAIDSINVISCLANKLDVAYSSISISSNFGTEKI